MFSVCCEGAELLMQLPCCQRYAYMQMLHTNVPCAVGSDIEGCLSRDCNIHTHTCAFGPQVPIQSEGQTQEETETTMQETTMQEVSAYSQLRHLQGRYIPRLVAHG